MGKQRFQKATLTDAQWRAFDRMYEDPEYTLAAIRERFGFTEAGAHRRAAERNLTRPSRLGRQPRSYVQGSAP